MTNAIATAEKTLQIDIPLAHRRDLENAKSEIHQACDLLTVDGNEHLDIVRRNLWLREGSWQGWGPNVVAFASSGCGDFFAYDLNTKPYRVFYVDPLETVEESLTGDSDLVFSSYTAWRDYEIHAYRQDT